MLLSKLREEITYSTSKTFITSKPHLVYSNICAIPAVEEENVYILPKNEMNVVINDHIELSFTSFHQRGLPRL